MSADLVAFVDSNVLVYAVSQDEPEKQRQARKIVERGFAEKVRIGLPPPARLRSGRSPALLPRWF